MQAARLLGGVLEVQGAAGGDEGRSLPGDGAVRVGDLDVAGEIVSALVLAARDPESYVRSAVAEALGRTRRDSAGEVAALVVLLSDSEASVKTAAARALGDVGAVAKVALPELERAAQGESLCHRVARDAASRIRTALEAQAGSGSHS
jgi:HEAT repeat protein